MKTYQLILVGQLTGNGINFGFFPSREAALAFAAGVNPELYASPRIIEIDPFTA
jgi:hypothetical protein